MDNSTQAGDLLSEKEVAAILKVSRHTLQNWRWSNTGLRALKIGTRAVRYRRSEVEAFINGERRQVAR